MSTRSVARQYAQALFDVAQRSGQVEPIGRQLADVTALVASHEELGLVFSSPAIAADRKRALVQGMLDLLPGVAPELQRLLLMLAERDRLMILDEIAAAFSERAMQAGGVVRAELTSATPLDARVRAEIVTALGSAVGRDVRVSERVDPAIIGGLVAKVGSVVFDGSVARHLERLRERLLART